MLPLRPVSSKPQGGVINLSGRLVPLARLHRHQGSVMTAQRITVALLLCLQCLICSSDHTPWAPFQDPGRRYQEQHRTLASAADGLLEHGMAPFMQCRPFRS